MLAFSSTLHVAATEVESTCMLVDSQRLGQDSNLRCPRPHRGGLSRQIHGKSLSPDSNRGFLLACWPYTVLLLPVENRHYSGRGCGCGMLSGLGCFPSLILHGTTVVIPVLFPVYARMCVCGVDDLSKRQIAGLHRVGGIVPAVPVSHSISVVNLSVLSPLV